MAKKHDVTIDDRVFMGERKKLRFIVAGEDGVTPIDVTGKTFRWVLGEDPTNTLDTVKVVKESNLANDHIRVGGVFDDDPNANEQYVEVDLDPEDTSPLYAGKFYHALRQIDVNEELLLSYGEFILQQAAGG